MTIDFKPLPKQFLALQYLSDKTTKALLYGGSIGSGKSFLASAFLLLTCLQYPGVRILLGRAELKNLKQTTLNTFFDLADKWQLANRYNYNKVESIITFDNGSEIILKDLKLNPSDPEFVSLGGHEFTAAVLDEAAEISEKAFTIIQTRLRYKLKEYNLVPKILICSNPCKGWLYDKFYKPYIDGELPKHRKFIQALPGDNEHLPQSYVETLTVENLGLAHFNTLVLGNWDFASSDLDLFEPDALNQLFYNVSPVPPTNRYITIDPASTGKDSTVITVWIGLDCVKIVQLHKYTTERIVAEVKSLMQSYNVRINNVITDKVGVGTGVFDLLKGSVGFVANARALNEEPFSNLKAQLYYKFAQLVNTMQVGITDGEYREEIIQELSAHKRFNTEHDKKAEVTPKALVKQMIGRSPDLSDALSMRAYFEYRKKALPVWY